MVGVCLWYLWGKKRRGVLIKCRGFFVFWIRICNSTLSNVYISKANKSAWMEGGYSWIKICDRRRQFLNTCNLGNWICFSGEYGIVGQEIVWKYCLLEGNRFLSADFWTIVLAILSKKTSETFPWPACLHMRDDCVWTQLFWWKKTDFHQIWIF